jgi:hypothetical protein
MILAEILRIGAERGGRVGLEAFLGITGLPEKQIIGTRLVGQTLLPVVVERFALNHPILRTWFTPSLSPHQVALGSSRRIMI